MRQGSWSPSVLNFVNSLNTHGANSVWEHTLMEALAPKNLKRKPLPKDPLHPTKSDFIRAKHVHLSFVLKPNLQQLEDSSNSSSAAGGVGVITIHNNSTTSNNNNFLGEIELNKQLHASVRSGNLETSLRFIVQGADPNYYNEVITIYKIFYK